MLEMKNACVGYGTRTVLSGASLTVGPGQLPALLGPNGCGKSTLLRALLGLIPLSAGEVTLAGKPLTALHRRTIARRIAYLPQGQPTPEMTVGELVLCGRYPHLSYPYRYSSADRRLADEAMARVGVSALAERPLHTLSGGMLQTAYLAMALAAGCDYILLDEPTTYLDATHGLALMRLLQELAAEGCGILTVMHDLPMAFAFSDKVILLGEGKALLTAPPQEVAASPLLKQAMGIELIPQPNGQGYAYKYL